MKVVHTSHINGEFLDFLKLTDIRNKVNCHVDAGLFQSLALHLPPLEKSVHHVNWDWGNLCSET